VTLERIETPPFTLPTPPPGMKWHREDGWTAEMLPPETRPLYRGESCEQGDEFFVSAWHNVSLDFATRLTSRHLHTRTTRPLIFTHSGHEWTWHRAGDPMPDFTGKKVVVLDARLFDYSEPETVNTKEYWGNKYPFPILGWRYADAEKPDDGSPWTEWHGGPCPLKDEEVEEWEYKMRDGETRKCGYPFSRRWEHLICESDIIAYRVLKWRTPKPKVQLGPEDVRCGDELLMAGKRYGILTVTDAGVEYLASHGRHHVTFVWLQKNGVTIRRRNSDTWEACEK
jgi:hypothetical protein